MLLFNQVNSSLSHFQVTSGDADVVDPATDGLTKFVWTADYCPLICGDTLFNMAHGAWVSDATDPTDYVIFINNDGWRHVQ